jgi:hypothetical protein
MVLRLLSRDGDGGSDRSLGNAQAECVLEHLLVCCRTGERSRCVQSRYEVREILLIHVGLQIRLLVGCCDDARGLDQYSRYFKMSCF